MFARQVTHHLIACKVNQSRAPVVERDSQDVDTAVLVVHTDAPDTHPLGFEVEVVMRRGQLRVSTRQVGVTHVMRNDAARTQRMNEAFQIAGVGDAIGGIARNENVHVARRLLAASVATHDLDPKLGVDLQGCLPNKLVQLAALFAWDARYEVVVELDAELPVSYCSRDP